MNKLEPNDYRLHKVSLKGTRSSRKNHDLCRPCIFYDVTKSSEDIYCIASEQGVDFVGCHSTVTHTYVYRRKLISILKNL